MTRLQLRARGPTLGSLALLIGAYPPERRMQIVAQWGGIGALAVATGPSLGAAIAGAESAAATTATAVPRIPKYDASACTLQPCSVVVGWDADVHPAGTFSRKCLAVARPGVVSTQWRCGAISRYA